MNAKLFASGLLTIATAACSPPPSTGPDQPDTAPSASPAPTGPSPTPAALTPFDVSVQGAALVIDTPCQSPSASKAANGEATTVKCAADQASFAIDIGSFSDKSWATGRERATGFKKWFQNDPDYLLWQQGDDENARGFAVKKSVGGRDYVCSAETPTNDGRVLDTMVRACRSLRVK